MQHTASLVQIAASRRAPALVAGVGATFVASAITLSVMISGAAPATAPQQADELKLTGDELSASEPKRPIFVRVRHEGDENVA